MEDKIGRLHRDVDDPFVSLWFNSFHERDKQKLELTSHIHSFSFFCLSSIFLLTCFSLLDFMVAADKVFLSSLEICLGFKRRHAYDTINYNFGSSLTQFWSWLYN